MSYSVLLIDDNQVALEALKKTVPWENLNLQLVGCAVNGVQGMEMIRKYSPDIILSDIQMPEMDGLEMVELMQEQLSASRVLFITAYEKIEYASRAIRLSAFDFLLKPLDNKELEKTLRRATESLDKERNREKNSDDLLQTVRRARFLSALSQKNLVGGKEGFLAFLEKIPEQYLFLVAEDRNGITNPVLQRIQFVTFPENTEIITTVADGELVMLCSLPADTEQGAWQSTAKKIADLLIGNMLDGTVAISNPHTDASEFHAAYEEALQTLMEHNIYGRHTDIDFFNTPVLNQAKKTRIMDLEQTSSRLAQKIDTCTVDELWKSIQEKSGGRMRMIRIMLMFFCTKVMQEKAGNSIIRESIDDVTVYGLTKLHSEADAREWLEKFCSEIKNVNIPASVSLVRQVLEYLKANVTDGLMLEEVAARFFVSPNYLSALIRKETGKTYRQHVIDAKVEAAKQMLDDTRMRVEDIAYAVGYENYISFYNIFRKMENMSPTEYRYSKRNE